MKLSPMIMSSAALITLITAVPAMAHTGHSAGSGLQSGLLHPLSGLDHLLAMLAIGFWAAMQNRAQQISIPVTFILFLAVGFFMATGGVVLPLVEHTIAASVLVCGLIIATAVRLPAIATLTLTALFACAHGQAHGAEVSGASVLLFAAGFMSSSAILHLTGMGIFKASRTLTPRLAHIAGAVIASVGSYLLLTI
ncbi:HupE/UreJ family protein [Amphritea pacifica]|uniref:HupE/UreJ family protein n=1 Tax=Amphritea pacifica TaxID=2811233 RepID=A0ABS2W3C7_9GAMM|nr:HupE/UreJ family protein [Amphritea pacifica]MBN0986126.1 HupE/UreJ family protein [Amphritea pacifica]